MNLKEPSPAHTPTERLAAHQRAKQPIAPARLGRADSARNVSVPNEGTFTHSSDKRRGRVAQKSLPSWFPSGNVSADHAYEVASGFEGLFGVVARNESGVVIEGHVSLAAEAVEDNQQASVFLVKAAPDELDDRDMMPRLASRAKAMAEHETQRGL